jgi:hypothetical protein
MIVSCWEPDRLPQASSTAERIGRASLPLRANCAQTQPKQRPGKAQAAEGMPRPDRDETGFGYGCGLSLGLISPITSSRPGHTGVSPKCTHMRGFAARRRRTPLVGASALHGVSGVSSGSHLGSTLKPGGAVLTRGVSRRSGSVACIRADASPTEVLASPSWHRKRCRSNIIGKNLRSAARQCRSER